MIEENEVKMLTKLARFEYETGKSEKELKNLTKGKYVAHGVFWAIVSSTAAFLLVLLLISYIRGTFNDNLVTFLNGDFQALFYPYIWISYLIYEGCFILIAIAFYSQGYKKLEVKLEEYLRRRSTYEDFYNRRNQ